MQLSLIKVPDEGPSTGGDILPELGFSHLLFYVPMVSSDLRG